MSDETSFLKEMQRNPGDKVSRMIYADWLEERGDPRGPINRVAASDATWYCGHQLRASAIDAMHFAWDTQVRIALRTEHNHYYVADAAKVFHEFAVWIAHEFFEAEDEPTSHPDEEQFHVALRAKMSWLDGKLKTRQLEALVSQLPPGGGSPARRDAYRSRSPAAFTAIRLAANTTALSAAKHTSRFAQKSRLDRVSISQQDFQLTQMLIDRCRWRRE